MKNLLFGLIATVMISVSGYSNISMLSTSENSIIKELPQEVRIQYSYGNNKVFISKFFESEGLEMQSFIATEIEKMNLILNLKENSLLHCSVTVHVGTANNFIEVVVSGECKEVVAEAARLKKQLMAAL